VRDVSRRGVELKLDRLDRIIGELGTGASSYEIASLVLPVCKVLRSAWSIRPGSRFDVATAGQAGELEAGEGYKTSHLWHFFLG
jgi:hypothetical protein